MKKLIAVVAMFFSLACYAQSTANERDALMKNLEEVLRPSSLKGIRQAFGGGYGRLLEADKKLNPEVTADTWNKIAKDYEGEVERVFSQPGGFTTLIAKEIAVDMSNDEIRQVIAFLSTEAGKKYSAVGERMGKILASNQARAVLSFSMLDMYSAKVTLLGNKYGLKPAPLELRGGK